MTTTELVSWTDDHSAVLEAFCEEKLNYNKCPNTPATYRPMVRNFFGRTGLMPKEVRPEHIIAWANAPKRDGSSPAPITVAMRIAAISQFFDFLIRTEILPKGHGNPVDPHKVKRPKVQWAPRGLTADEMKRLLEVIPMTCAGLRDRAIILSLVFTGCRRMEILNLRAKDITRNGGIYITYRSKGNEERRKELPPPAIRAIEVALKACERESDLGMLSMEEPEALLFDVAPEMFAQSLNRYFRRAKIPARGVHILRHTAAQLRYKEGREEEIRAFLGHKSLETTMVYLRRLVGEDDERWPEVAKQLGLEA